MIDYTIAGYRSFMSKKNDKEYYVIYVLSKSPGVTGLAADNFICSPSVIVGGSLRLNVKCHVSFDRRGFVQEVELLDSDQK